MWKIGQDIGNIEGRMDVCVAAAGVVPPAAGSLDYPAEALRDNMDVNLTGMLFTAQSAGRQMVRFGNGGSPHREYRWICWQLGLYLPSDRAVADVHAADRSDRTWVSFHTTSPSLVFCRWRAVWPASLVQMESV